MIKITSSFLVIKYLGDNRKVKLSIIDLLGREQKIVEDDKKKGMHTVFIPLKRLPVGCYFLCLKEQDYHIIRSFVIR